MFFVFSFPEFLLCSCFISFWYLHLSLKNNFYHRKRLFFSTEGGCTKHDNYLILFGQTFMSNGSFSEGTLHQGNFVQVTLHQGKFVQVTLVQVKFCQRNFINQKLDYVKYAKILQILVFSLIYAVLWHISNFALCLCPIRDNWSIVILWKMICSS